MYSLPTAGLTLIKSPSAIILNRQYLLYKGAAALCAGLAQPRLSQLVDAIGSAFGLVLGMTGAGALILLVSLVSAVTAVVS